MLDVPDQQLPGALWSIPALVQAGLRSGFLPSPGFWELEVLLFLLCLLTNVVQ